MKHNATIPDSSPVAVYNADKRELIGLFSNMAAACKYVFPYTDHRLALGRLCYARNNKSTFKLGNFVGCRIAVRDATTKQVDAIGDRIYRLTRSYAHTDKTKHLFSEEKRPQKARRNRLITPDKEAFILANYEELTPSEIAGQIEITVATVRHFMCENGIPMLRPDGRFLHHGEEKKDPNIFDVDEYTNWLTGSTKGMRYD